MADYAVAARFTSSPRPDYPAYRTVEVTCKLTLYKSPRPGLDNLSAEVAELVGLQPGQQESTHTVSLPHSQSRYGKHNISDLIIFPGANCQHGEDKDIWHIVLIATARRIRATSNRSKNNKRLKAVPSEMVKDLQRVLLNAWQRRDKMVRPPKHIDLQKA